MVSRDAVIGLSGAAVILVAALGVAVIESRAGPHVHDVGPAAIPGTVSGSYVATAGRGSFTGPGGICVGDPPTEECTQPVHALDVRIRGLPQLAAGLHYVAFLLVEGQNAQGLGPFAREGDDEVLMYHEDRDGRAFTHLVVSLEARADAAAPSERVLYRTEVGPRMSDAPVNLAASFTTALGQGRGTLTLHQIGAVTVSITATASVTGLHAPPPGWSYVAWLGSTRGGEAVHTRLGPLAFDEEEPARGSVSARVERIWADEQDRFLVTLEPEAPPSGDAAPAGFPVAEAWL